MGGGDGPGSATAVNVPENLGLHISIGVAFQVDEKILCKVICNK